MTHTWSIKTSQIVSLFLLNGWKSLIQSTSSIMDKTKNSNINLTSHQNNSKIFYHPSNPPTKKNLSSDQINKTTFFFNFILQLSCTFSKIILFMFNINTKFQKKINEKTNKKKKIIRKFYNHVFLTFYVWDKSFWCISCIDICLIKWVFGYIFFLGIIEVFFHSFDNLFGNPLLNEFKSSHSLKGLDSFLIFCCIMDK